METVRIRNIEFGEGKPKICVPLTGRDEEEIVRSAKQIALCGADLCEWRADYYDCALSETVRMLGIVRKLLVEMPLLFTFRSEEEGGEKKISTSEYEALLRAVLLTGKTDMADLELFKGDTLVSSLIRTAHENGCAAIVSSHDFRTTPPYGEMLARLFHMRELGADLCKLAVMPEKEEDVESLLNVCQEFTSASQAPCVAISMSSLGSVSRVKGGLYGSVMTFASCTSSSAPGQIDIKEMKEMLDRIYG